MGNAKMNSLQSMLHEYWTQAREGVENPRPTMNSCEILENCIFEEFLSRTNFWVDIKNLLGEKRRFV
jgi:hypothetical protein